MDTQPDGKLQNQHIPKNIYVITNIGTQQRRRRERERHEGPMLQSSRSSRLG
jgi:hypothetical protein